ncbi:SMI1/KNR4 family protein [Streptomyces sp. H51]|uniref:SMI1/KNR4 family protein n=1 Tax=Streptomyces sp. H51 TaxID=3111770 RepID=UPI002D778439|nr:SMI1/KNR4 family protein [Streptomyces sp. H51]
MNDRWWAGVRERVAAVGAAAARGEVFGAVGHEWVLEEPLAPAELAELETQTGVRLPEEYRDFLLHVGAGGAGPAYGVFPVRRVRGRWRWEGDGADLADLGRLAEPFPEHGPDPELLKSLLSQCPEEEDFTDIEDFDEAMEAWDERWSAVLFAPERTAGAVAICHLGCAQREWLIVSGTRRGTIWSDCRVDDVDLAPLLDEDGTPLTFARWYLRWLEECERTALSAPSTGP